MDISLDSDSLIRIVLDSFDAERIGDIEKGKSLITDDFLRQSMIVSGDTIFPKFSSTGDTASLDQTYSVKGREFHVWNIATNIETQTVFVELVEIEPRDAIKKVWPYVLVCKIENGKIKRSRHYGDPATLAKQITLDDVKEAVEG